MTREERCIVLFTKKTKGGRKQNKGRTAHCPRSRSRTAKASAANHATAPRVQRSQQDLRADVIAPQCCALSASRGRADHRDTQISKCHHVLCCVASVMKVLARSREKVRQKSQDSQCTRCGLRGRGCPSFRTAPNSGNGYLLQWGGGLEMKSFEPPRTLAIGGDGNGLYPHGDGKGRSYKYRIFRHRKHRRHFGDDPTFR